MASSVAFAVVAGALVLSALAVILSRNLVHAALAMAAHFSLTAALYVLLHAPLLAAVQLLVYAGAIMVLFLFAVMIVGERDVGRRESLAGQRVLAVLGLAVLGAVLVFAVVGGVPAAGPSADAPPVPAEFGSPAAVAGALFRRHVFPFEVVSVLLLVAMIGAVVLARSRPAEGAPAEPPPGEEGG